MTQLAHRLGSAITALAAASGVVLAACDSLSSQQPGPTPVDVNWTAEFATDEGNILVALAETAPGRVLAFVREYEKLQTSFAVPLPAQKSPMPRAEIGNLTDTGTAIADGKGGAWLAGFKATEIIRFDANGVRVDAVTQRDDQGKGCVVVAMAAAPKGGFESLWWCPQTTSLMAVRGPSPSIVIEKSLDPATTSVVAGAIAPDGVFVALKFAGSLRLIPAAGFGANAEPALPFGTSVLPSEIAVQDNGNALLCIGGPVFASKRLQGYLPSGAVAFDVSVAGHKGLALAADDDGAGWLVAMGHDTALELHRLNSKGAVTANYTLNSRTFFERAIWLDGRRIAVSVDGMPGKRPMAMALVAIP